MSVSSNQNQSFLKFLEELKNLNLPKGKFAIFGSGPIAIRGIRDTHDLDIIVKNEVYLDLSRKYPEKVVTQPVNCIQLGNIEIGNSWLNSQDEINEMIDSAEIIKGLPFVRLDYLLKWKKQMGREKDIRDIRLIKEYLKTKEKQT